MKQTQLVSIAALTMSSSGKTTKARMPMPIMCSVSATSTTMKSSTGGFLYDLNRQMRTDLRKVPISGMIRAKKSAHVHATRSTSGTEATYVFWPASGKNNFQCISNFLFFCCYIIKGLHFLTNIVLQYSNS